MVVDFDIDDVVPGQLVIAKLALDLELGILASLPFAHVDLFMPAARDDLDDVDQSGVVVLMRTDKALLHAREIELTVLA